MTIPFPFRPVKGLGQSPPTPAAGGIYFDPSAVAQRDALNNQMLLAFQQNNAGVFQQAAASYLKLVPIGYGLPVWAQTIQVDANGNLVNTYYQSGSGVTVPPPQTTGPLVTKPAPIGPLPPTSKSMTTYGFSIVNTTTGISNPSIFTVGDGYKIVITGSPNSTVKVTSTQNGVASSTSYSTDATGTFVLVGNIQPGDVGSWTEQWSNNGNVWNISFSVAQPKQQGTSAQNTSMTAGTMSTGATPTVTTTGTSVNLSTFSSDFVTGLNDLFTPSNWSAVFSSGSIGQIIGLLAVPLAGVYFMSQGGRFRR